MECVLLIGIQGSGKSAFFKDRFADTHVRINLDMLRTRSREARFFQLCLATRQRCVIDNTNPRVTDRAEYLRAARAAGFAIHAYWFDVPVKEALQRNAARAPEHRVPVPGIYRTAKFLEPPKRIEGFDALYRVRVVDGAFVVDPIGD